MATTAGRTPAGTATAVAALGLVEPEAEAEGLVDLQESRQLGASGKGKVTCVVGELDALAVVDEPPAADASVADVAPAVVSLEPAELPPEVVPAKMLMLSWRHSRDREVGHTTGPDAAVTTCMGTSGGRSRATESGYALPVATVKGALVAGAPVLSLIWKRREEPACGAKLGKAGCKGLRTHQQWRSRRAM
ncbi:hypothetical protein B0H10DRAFT_1946580 [Mycena sp. CBHHK59/15]|nr:hypothetical protein B0H10DRAFT_1946580 [Mycena sp. CBHHK59/15]